MRQAHGQHSARVLAAIALIGAGSVIGWLAGGSTGAGVGVGLAVTAVTLAATARRDAGVAGLEATSPVGTTEGWLEVRRELARARRHEHPFVLIRMPATGGGPSGNDHSADTADAESLGRSLRPFLRTMDSLWVSDGYLYLLLPESSRSMGEAFLARIRHAHHGAVPEADMVGFPEDGVTAGALLALLHGRTVARYAVPFTPDAVRMNGKS